MRAVQKYNTNISTILIVAGIAIILFVLLRNKQQLLPSGVSNAALQNAENWEIEYNSDGLPIRVIVHRDTKVNN